MTVKLDTINISDNKVSKKQYAFNKLDDINLGLLHQVVKGSRTNFRNNTASVKHVHRYLEQVQNLGHKREQVGLDKVL